MITIIIIIIIIFVWMAYEFHTAPYIDDDGNIIKKKDNDTRTKKPN